VAETHLVAKELPPPAISRQEEKRSSRKISDPFFGAFCTSGGGIAISPEGRYERLVLRGFVMLANRSSE